VGPQALPAPSPRSEQNIPASHQHAKMRCWGSVGPNSAATLPIRLFDFSLPLPLHTKRRVVCSSPHGLQPPCGHERCKGVGTARAMTSCEKNFSSHSIFYLFIIGVGGYCCSRSHSMTHTYSVGFPGLRIGQSQWSLPVQHKKTTRDRHACPQFDSNPYSQQSSGRRPATEIECIQANVRNTERGHIHGNI